MTASAQWPGLPVQCTICLSRRTPVMAEDGWRLPVHRWDLDSLMPCPGSMAGVSAPAVPHDMETRIEETFVRAMPERVSDDWSAP